MFAAPFMLKYQKIITNKQARAEEPVSIYTRTPPRGMEGGCNVEQHYGEEIRKKTI